MTFTFVIGQDLTLLFQVAGADPSPQPPPVSVYSVSTIDMPGISGFITDDFEEVE